ncbi:hypothetical protein GCM10027605_37970 [Micromonospora zhanjiangensis]
MIGQEPGERSGWAAGRLLVPEPHARRHADDGRDAGRRLSVVSHFNKATKGRLVRDLLVAGEGGLRRTSGGQVRSPFRRSRFG